MEAYKVSAACNSCKKVGLMKEILEQNKTVCTCWTPWSSTDNVQAQACRGRQWGLGRGRTSAPALPARRPDAFHMPWIFFTLWGEVDAETSLPSDAKARFWSARAHYNRHLRHKPEWPGAKQKTHKETQIKRCQDNKEEKQRLTEKQSKRVQCYDGWELTASRAPTQRGKLPVTCYWQCYNVVSLHCRETGSWVSPIVINR